MTSPLAAERAFPVLGRGQNRDDRLLFFRQGLRRLINPETGAAFTEDEIAAATAQQSRWWIESDADDLILLSEEQRGLYLAQQIHPGRASTGFLRGHHRTLWGEEPLGANGGSGPASAPAPVGAMWVGSTTVPDEVATKLRDQNGLRYQVLYTVTATAGGAGGGKSGAVLELKGIDTGTKTNLSAGAVLTYFDQAPLGAGPEVTVTDAFRDGAAAETDADYASRLLARIRRKPASGNDAHFRAWARAANVSVKDAFVYCCAFHAGSVLVCITSKRGLTKGPLGQQPSAGTLADVIAYLTPPGSPVVPRPPHVLVVKEVNQASNLVLVLDMRRRSPSGWADVTPWPEEASGVATTITTVTSQTSIRVTKPAGAAAPPAGVPSLMVWNDAESRFEKLAVLSVTNFAANVYTVTLSQAPAKTLTVGDVVSPLNNKHDVIAKAIEDYFDALGPGEVVDLASDDRAHRAYRVPEPFEESAQRAGSGIDVYLRDALGASLANHTLASISVTDPAIPADPSLGPSKLVPGKVGIYAK